MAVEDQVLIDETLIEARRYGRSKSRPVGSANAQSSASRSACRKGRPLPIFSTCRSIVMSGRTLGGGPCRVPMMNIVNGGGTCPTTRSTSRNS